MPKHLVRYQKCGVFHFITFSCYRRRPFLNSVTAYRTFELELERVRLRFGFVVARYVLMPEPGAPGLAFETRDSTSPDRT